MIFLRTYFGVWFTTPEILIVPSEDFINRTGDFDFSSFSFPDEGSVNFNTSGGVSPSGNSNAVSSPVILAILNKIHSHFILF